MQVANKTSKVATAEGFILADAFLSGQLWAIIPVAE